MNIVITSLTYSDTSTKKNLFSKLYSENPTSLYPTWDVSQHKVSNGLYIGSNCIVSGYYGESLEIGFM